MSNGRAHRRRVHAGQTRTLLVEADTQAPAVVFGAGKGDGSLVQPVFVGQVMYAVAVPPEGASAPLLRAYSIRATASVTGQCPACGARRHVRHTGHVGSVTFHHEPDCSAADDNLVALVSQEKAS